MKKINFLNITVDNVTMKEAIEQIEILIKKKKNSYVVTPNLDHIIQLEKDKEFQNVYKNADLVLTDGKPLIWISKLLGTPIKEKISGSDLFPYICKLAANRGFSVFMLGAADGVAKKATDNLKVKYPDLRISGFYSPKFGFENDKDELENVIRVVKKSSPDILVVGLGAPKQEKFIYNFKDTLNVPLSLGLGATIDFEAGTVKRAPKWMQKIGLEWLFRITQDPKRLMKRYFGDFIGIFPIIFEYRNEMRK